jgi:hypothetical protein
MDELANLNASELREVLPSDQSGADEVHGFDMTHLDDSLAMTPWERMLANDDMVNFGDSLRAAMEKRHAESR